MDKLAEIVLTTAAKRSLEFAFDGVKSLLKRYTSDLSASASEIEKAISDHQTEIASWASEVSFRDFPRGRRTDEVFVPLDIYLNRIRSRVDDELLEEVKLEDVLLSDERSCVILGQPGAGKTTALKHICQRFFTEPAFLSQYQLIVRIQLRELNVVTPTASPEYLSRLLQEMLRLRISYPDDLGGDENIGARRALRDRVVIDWLNSVHALVILDGFDEITLKARRDLTTEEIRRLAPQMTTAAFILTGRSGEFSYHIEK